MNIVNIEFPLKNSIRLSEPEAVTAMLAGLNRLKKVGAIKGEIDDILVSYQFTDKLGYCVASVDDGCIVDASKLNTIGASLSFPIDPNLMKPVQQYSDPEDRQFSTATIQERLRLSAMNPRMKFKLTLQDYKRYWQSNRTKIEDKPVNAKNLKNMFLIDLTGIFSQILPYIQEGKQLDSLIGVNLATEGLNTVSKELSMAYKKALQQSSTGQISKTVFTQLQNTYSKFINMLVPQVFPGIEDVLKNLPKEGKTRSFSDDDESIVTLICNDSDQIIKVLQRIKSRLDKDKSTMVTIKSTNEADDNGEVIYIDSTTQIYSVDEKGTKSTTLTTPGSTVESKVTTRKIFR